MAELPLIDIGPALAAGARGVEPSGDHDGALRRLATDLDQACTATGFFLVIGHSLERTVESLFGLTRAFFALPQGVKEAIPRSASFGFVPDRQHALDQVRLSGATEYLDLSLEPDFGADIDAAKPPVAGFAAALAAYQAQALAVAEVVLAGVAVALSVEPSYFADRMTRPECKLRLLHYRPSPAGPDGPSVPNEPHTDYGAITLLATDGVAGLQVRPRGGDWTAVTVPPGALVVNLGDMLARWTNLRYASTLHRVVGSAQHRYSIPFFVNPDPDTVVECLPSCVTAAQPARFAPVLASAYLAGRIDKSIPEPYLDGTEPT